MNTMFIEFVNPKRRLINISEISSVEFDPPRHIGEGYFIVRMKNGDSYTVANEEFSTLEKFLNVEWSLPQGEFHEE